MFSESNAFANIKKKTKVSEISFECVLHLGVLLLELGVLVVYWKAIIATRMRMLLPDFFRHEFHEC